MSDSEGTFSSISWVADDFEIKSVKKITSALEAVEKILYGEETSSLVNEELGSECCKWAAAFPHLRVMGLKIAVGQRDCEIQSANIDERTKSFEKRTTDLQYHETLHDDDDEIMACSFDGVSMISTKHDSLQNYSKGRKCTSPHLSTVGIKQQIIDKIASQILENVISVMKSSGELTISAIKEEERLPPIFSGNSLLQQYKFKTKFPSSYDVENLEGILTVSPKILLPRNDMKAICEVQQRFVPTKPKSTTNTCKSSTAVSRLPLHAKNSRARKMVRPSLYDEPFLLHLEEGDSCSLSCLQGTHLELQGKIVKNKFVSSHGPVVSHGFLPPIDDIGRMPSSAVQEVTSSFEPCVKNGLLYKQPSLNGPHLNRISSRPSTSRISLDEKNSELKSIIAEDKNAPKREKPGCGVNLVNLLPLVTSKELGEKKKLYMK